MEDNILEYNSLFALEIDTDIHTYVTGNHGNSRKAGCQDHRCESLFFGRLLCNTSNATEAGLPRTSTTSLKKGLELLGISPCFHLGDPPAPISRVKESARVMGMQDKKERLKALKKLYDGFEAVFEPPASALVDDMLEIYPDAKVL